MVCFCFFINLRGPVPYAYGTRSRGHLPGSESGLPWPRVNQIPNPGPWVRGVTHPTKLKGEAGGEWMTESGTDPQRLWAVVNRRAEKP